MNQEEQEGLIYQSQLNNQAGQLAMQSANAQYYMQEQEKTIAEAQLECDKILEKCRHILRQDLKKYNEDGSFDWVPIDESKRTLTDFGVDRIMQTMEIYVNKENLLSNYDVPLINRRMLDFCQALNRNIFMKYELYFRIPTIEEAIEIIKLGLNEKVKIKVFTEEFFGLVPDRNKITNELLKEMEERIYYEISKIRKQKQKQNIVEYELLFTELVAIVESVHQRAYRGEERGSLRRHMNISEVIGSMPSRTAEKGGMFKWLRG